MVRRRNEAGFSLIETMIVLGTVTLTILGVITAHLTCARLGQTNHETQAAAQRVRTVMEEISSTDVVEVPALFDHVPDNDPGGAGTAPGHAFATTALSSNSSGDRGAILLPVNNAGEVREDIVIPELGMPRDLNGDGSIDSANHAADFHVLPVLVRLRWSGISGNREMRLMTILAR